MASAPWSAIFLGVCLLFGTSGSTWAADRPNFLILCTDDQASYSLGCYGHPDVTTPAIDRLAQRGVCFDRHYVSTAICMASRATMMTGLTEYRTGCNFMHGPLARSIWLGSYPIRLRQAGYRTGFGGKFGFAVTDDPLKPASERDYADLPVNDFDVWFGGTGQTSYVTANNAYLKRFSAQYPHSTLAYAEAGREFIRDSVQGEQPFCLTLFFKAPHKPAQPDPRFDPIYRQTTFGKLPNFGRVHGEHLVPQHRMGRQYPRFVTWGYSQEQTYQHEMRKYHQLIHGVDVAVDLLIDQLEQSGVAGQTIIIFTSDNGYFNGSHGLGSKVLLYEESVRVPMIVVDPRRPDRRGTRVSSLTANLDLAPTILDYAGLRPNPDLDGLSLKPLVEGTAERIRDKLTLIQVWGTQGTVSMGLLTEQFKYLYWPYAEGIDPGEELFDLQSDPYELVNLMSARSDSPELADMRSGYDQALENWRTQASEHGSYREFATILDRQTEWEVKRKLFPKSFPVNSQEAQAKSRSGSSRE